MKEKRVEEMAKDIHTAEVGFVKERIKCIEQDMDFPYNTKAQYQATCLISKGYRRQSEWISVEDRLPEPRQDVLVYAYFHNKWQIIKGWYSIVGKAFRISNNDYPSKTDIQVTHWMPLPEAPKMKGGVKL